MKHLLTREKFLWSQILIIGWQPDQIEKEFHVYARDALSIYEQFSQETRTDVLVKLTDKDFDDNIYGDKPVTFSWPINDFIFVNIHRFVVPESPRWLLCKGRVSEVKEILKKAARFNGRELPDNLDKYLKPPCNAEDSASGFIELFRTKYLRLVTFCFLCIWFTMNLVYYGLILNMNSFGGNFYVNSVSFSLFSAFIFPSCSNLLWKTRRKMSEHS